MFNLKILRPYYFFVSFRFSWLDFSNNRHAGPPRPAIDSRREQKLRVGRKWTHRVLPAGPTLHLFLWPCIPVSTKHLSSGILPPITFSYGSNMPFQSVHFTWNHKINLINNFFLIFALLPNNLFLFFSPCFFLVTTGRSSRRNGKY